MTDRHIPHVGILHGQETFDPFRSIGKTLPTAPPSPPDGDHQTSRDDPIDEDAKRWRRNSPVARKILHDAIETGGASFGDGIEKAYAAGVRDTASKEAKS